MINLGPPHRVIGGNHAGVWRYGWLSGLQEHSIRIESRHGTHLVSARLSPIGAVDLFGTIAAEAANAIVDLRKLLGNAGRALIDAIRDAPDSPSRFDVLEQFLLSRKPDVDVPAFVRAAASSIEKNHGIVRVSSLHEELAVSRKHLSVMFKRFVGVTPKGYAKLHRFAWTIQRLQSSDSVDWSRLALEAGYSDQSHLVRDFRRIGGDAATSLLGRLTPDGIALWET
jgi:AraC-like DNA-binding protein